MAQYLYTKRGRIRRRVVVFPVSIAGRFTAPARAIKVTGNVSDVVFPPAGVSSVQVIRVSYPPRIIDRNNYFADFPRFFTVFFREAGAGRDDCDGFFFRTGGAGSIRVSCAIAFPVSHKCRPNASDVSTTEPTGRKFMPGALKLCINVIFIFKKGPGCPGPSVSRGYVVLERATNKALGPVGDERQTLFSADGAHVLLEIGAVFQ